MELNVKTKTRQVRTAKFADFESAVNENFTTDVQPNVIAFLRNLEARGMINVRKETKEGAGRKSEFETDLAGFLSRVKNGEKLSPVSLEAALESKLVEKKLAESDKGRAIWAYRLTLQGHNKLAKFTKQD